MSPSVFPSHIPSSCQCQKWYKHISGGYFPRLRGSRRGPAWSGGSWSGNAAREGNGEARPGCHCARSPGAARGPSAACLPGSSRAWSSDAGSGAGTRARGEQWPPPAAAWLCSEAGPGVRRPGARRGGASSPTRPCAPLGLSWALTTARPCVALAALPCPQNAFPASPALLRRLPRVLRNATVGQPSLPGASGRALGARTRPPSVGSGLYSPQLRTEPQLGLSALGITGRGAPGATRRPLQTARFRRRPWDAGAGRTRRLRQDSGFPPA
nr:uncharacterized protein LOC112426125 [Macaca nemestrina]